MFRWQGQEASTTRRITTTIAVVTLSLVLAGCQSAVNRSQGGGDNAEPVTGGTLTVAQASDAAPSAVQIGRSGNSTWASNVFETLTRYDEEKAPQPLLATEWTVVEDGLSMDISLRDDVTFHTGRPLTAADVQYSIETIAASPSQVAFIAKKIAAVDIVDDTGLTLTFAEKIPNIFDLFEYMFILDSETAGNGLADGSAVVGTGPFLFDRWVPGSEIVLKRNDDYWDGPAYLGQITIAVIGDGTAMLNAVRSGRIQVAVGMDSQDVQTLEGNPEFELVAGGLGLYPVGVNVDAKPFDTKEVRQAVQFAIDRDRIAEQAFGRGATPTSLFWDDASKDFPSQLDDAYAYDVDKARAMIREAGATGTPVTISVISIPNNAGVAEIVRNNLEEVGLKPTIKLLEVPSFDESQRAGQLGEMFMPLHGTSGFSPITLMDVLPSLREGNPSNFWTDEYVALREALVDADEDQYAGALEALSAYIIDEAFTANTVRVAGETVVSTAANGLVWTERAQLDARKAFISK
ncbi:ABC transporter substrate-binding protein [Prescottella equi]